MTTIILRANKGSPLTNTEIDANFTNLNTDKAERVSPTLVTPILGTPVSVTLTNATGLPVSTGISGLGTNVASFLTTPSSANLAAALTDETGTGSAVFATSPVLVTPALGTPASGVMTNVTGTAAGLTAGTVTTNANLTGVITSTGNATAIADATLSIAKTSGLQAAIDLKQNLSGKDAANGYAGLDASSKISPSQLPALAITDTFVVASQAAQIAVTAEVGDVVVRTDLNKSFILQTSPASTFANWKELLTPTDSVSSVFGRTGVVTAQSGDYTAAQVGAPAGSGSSTGTNTGDQTNISGNAATVTTNANLTGPVTSIGNATSFTSGMTLPAFTLGGTVAGGGNQINNVVIGTTTPLAGAFTTLSATGTITANTFAGTVDGTDAIGFRNIPQNSQSAAYTAVLSDSGKHIFHPSTDANARTYTIPANSSVAYPIGTIIVFVNMSSNVVTIAITTDTMYLSGTGTTGSRSLALYGAATAMKMTATTWIISGSGLT